MKYVRRLHDSAKASNSSRAVSPECPTNVILLPPHPAGNTRQEVRTQRYSCLVRLAEVIPWGCPRSINLYSVTQHPVLVALTDTRDELAGHGSRETKEVAWALDQHWAKNDDGGDEARCLSNSGRVHDMGNGHKTLSGLQRLHPHGVTTYPDVSIKEDTRLLVQAMVGQLHNRHLHSVNTEPHPGRLVERDAIDEVLTTPNDRSCVRQREESVPLLFWLAREFFFARAFWRSRGE